MPAPARHAAAAAFPLAGSATALAAPLRHVQIVADAQLRLRWRRHAGRPQNVRLLLNGHPAASEGQTEGGSGPRYRATMGTVIAPAPTRPSTPSLSAPHWQPVAHPPHTLTPQAALPASTLPAHREGNLARWAGRSRLPPPWGVRHRGSSRQLCGTFSRASPNISKSPLRVTAAGEGGGMGRRWGW